MGKMRLRVHTCKLCKHLIYDHGDGRAMNFSANIHAGSGKPHTCSTVPKDMAHLDVSKIARKYFQ